jgi:hypothetical protein
MMISQKFEVELIEFKRLGKLPVNLVNLYKQIKNYTNFCIDL